MLCTSTDLAVSGYLQWVPVCRSVGAHCNHAGFDYKVAKATKMFFVIQKLHRIAKVYIRTAESLVCRRDTEPKLSPKVCPHPLNAREDLRVETHRAVRSVSRHTERSRHARDNERIGNLCRYMASAGYVIQAKLACPGLLLLIPINDAQGCPTTNDDVLQRACVSVSNNLCACATNTQRSLREWSEGVAPTASHLSQKMPATTSFLFPLRGTICPFTYSPASSRLERSLSANSDNSSTEQRLRKLRMRAASWRSSCWMLVLVMGVMIENMI